MIKEELNHNNYLKEIPTCKIRVPANSIRSSDTPEQIELLGQNIKNIGLIHPIYVRQTDEGYELISGRRRLNAARSAGIFTVPCIVADMSDEDALALSLSENIQRKNLNYFEQAAAISTLMKVSSMTQAQIAEKLGKKQSTIANKLRLSAIPDEVKTYLLANDIKERQARALLRLDDPQKMLKAAQYCVKHKLNTAKFDAYVDRLAADKLKEKVKPFFKGLCRDIRLYINSLNHTYAMMKSSGIDTQMETNEDNEKIVYKIVINKQP